MILSVGACKDADRSQSIRIAAASNQSLVMQEMIQAWEEQTGLKADLITGSSGKLTAQISSGAPYDVFISADRKYMEHLQNLNLIQDSIYTIGHGRLALVWQAGLAVQNDDPTSLLSESQKVAVANPMIAPYGASAMSFLESEEIFVTVQPKLIYAENVAQVFQYVHTGAADVGLTALSLLAKNKSAEGVEWSPLSKSHTLIEQTATILASSIHTNNAQTFIAFLTSDEGKEILTSFGYLQD